MESKGSENIVTQNLQIGIESPQSSDIEKKIQERLSFHSFQNPSDKDEKEQFSVEQKDKLDTIDNKENMDLNKTPQNSEKDEPYVFKTDQKENSHNIMNSEYSGQTPHDKKQKTPEFYQGHPEILKLKLRIENLEKLTKEQIILCRHNQLLKSDELLKLIGKPEKKKIEKKNFQKPFKATTAFGGTRSRFDAYPMQLKDTKN